MRSLRPTPSRERCAQFWADVDGAQTCSPCAQVSMLKNERSSMFYKTNNVWPKVVEWNCSPAISGRLIIKSKIRRDVCCLILNAALQVHFLTEYRKKEPCYSCWAAELCCCYRKWWLASAFNDLSGNFRLTLAKKSGIAKISQIFATMSSDELVSNYLSWSYKGNSI